MAQIVIPDYPALSVQWYHAVDTPQMKPKASTLTHSSSKEGVKYPLGIKPSVWLPFSKRDSIALEAAFQENTPGLTVSVNEDYLFEVDIDDREIYPVYWPGPIYDVRRGTWFYQGDGNFFLPCEENLASQIEAGYLKHQLWVLPEEENNPDPLPSSEAKKKSISEKSWQLVEPYLSQYIVYTSPTTAWLLSDGVTGKLTKTVYAQLTNGVNLGGTRLIRGCDEVELTEKPPQPVKKENVENDLTKEKPISDQETRETEDYENEESEEEERTIDHLVLVIHGIGQKLSERMEWLNFIHDVNTLRRTIKNMCATNPPAEMLSRVDKLTQNGNGVQVLPIQWRQEIKFGIASSDQESQGLEPSEAEEGQTTLDEITLDGIPSLRMLISDALVDVLLYMTSQYREVMINTVTRECNRVYGLFLERNPRFLEIGGKVSILGHSLGSVLAFDILCHQPPVVPSTPSGIFDERNNPEMQKLHERLIKLTFPVKNFFAIGSPIGLFLMLKGLKIGSRRSQLIISQEIGVETPGTNPSIPRCYPAVRNLYNIFHRADPIAYRLEPLIARHYGASLRPALIPYHKGGLKAVHIGIQEFGTDIANKANNMISSIKSSLFSGFSGKQTRVLQATRSESPAEYESGNKIPSEASFRRQSTSYSEKEKEDPSGAAKLRDLNITGRVDYCLQEGILDVSYLNAITVHLSYWSDSDAAYFILRECYRGIEEEEEQSLQARALNLLKEIHEPESSIDSIPEHTADVVEARPSQGISQ